MKIKRLTIAISLLASTVAIALAQSENGTMTPYSSFGYGIIRDHATSTQRAMGSVGYAMNSGRQINVMNPASHAMADSLTFLFDMGVTMSTLWQSEDTSDGVIKNTDFGGGLDYVTMQFPLGRYMGASVGILPYSSVGYSFGSDIDNGADTRQGSGSLNELYVAVAGRPFKGFGVGVNASYLFGTLINETYATTASGSYSLFQRQMIVRDYHLNFGVQYSLGLGRGHGLTAGLTYSPGKTLLGTSRMLYYDPNQDSEPSFEPDVRLRNNFSIPETWGAGLAYRKGSELMVEFDYTYQPWSKARYMNQGEAVKGYFADRSRYAIGAQYTPDQRGGYGKRMSYRLGAFYCDDYLKIGTNRLRQYGVTAGFGFPVPVFKTTVNLGLEWLHRQATPNPLITENYLNISVGINFNEMWFRQSKIY